ncbi:hypothetical protein EMCRGX_G027242 [Ephydatia muelleri]
MISASNDTSGGEKRSSPDVDGVAIDGQKSHNSGQAVRNIKEEGGASSSSCSTDNNIVPEVITIEGQAYNSSGCEDDNDPDRGIAVSLSVPPPSIPSELYSKASPGENSYELSELDATHCKLLKD